MPSKHPMAELAPRDVVARCIFAEMTKANVDHIYLDATIIPDVSTKFPMIAATCKDYGIDITKDLIPIAPAAHYMMGGITTDDWGRTNISGLYACGEAACTGLQGANRLASNSLLEGLVFGRRTAKIINETRLPKTNTELFFKETSLTEKNQPFTTELTLKSQQLMSRYLGISRNAKDLATGENKLLKLTAACAGIAANTPAELDLQARLTTDLLILNAAKRRTESRGAHYRSDFPQTQESFNKHFHDQLAAKEKYNEFSSIR